MAAGNGDSGSQHLSNVYDFAFQVAKQFGVATLFAVAAIYGCYMLVTWNREDAQKNAAASAQSSSEQLKLLQKGQERESEQRSEMVQQLQTLNKSQETVIELHQKNIDQLKTVIERQGAIKARVDEIFHEVAPNKEESK